MIGISQARDEPQPSRTVVVLVILIVLIVVVLIVVDSHFRFLFWAVNSTGAIGQSEQMTAYYL